MSLISMYDTDHSAELARRFAAQTAAYLDDPETAKKRTSKIPMENLFRILEMYRYDAFEDENRGGVLAIESFESYPMRRSIAPSNWHEPILRALEGAMEEAFHLAQADNKENAKVVAIGELQTGLRQLANQGHVADPEAGRFKSFLARFQSLLI